MPLLATLAAQQHGAARGIQVVPVEADGLGDPRPGGVQQLQQSTVPQRGGSVADTACEQLFHLVERERTGQPGRQCRWAYLARDVVGQ